MCAPLFLSFSCSFCGVLIVGGISCSSPGLVDVVSSSSAPLVVVVVDMIAS